MNLFSMLQDAIRRHADKIALSSDVRRISFAEFDRITAALAEEYRALGCESGDRLVLFCRNRLEYPLLLWGAIRAGIVVVPVNVKLHPDELAWICQDADARLMVTDAAHRDEVACALLQTGTALIAVEDLNFLPQSAFGAISVVEVKADSPAWLFYTSGTTGRPKGAVLTHRNLIAATINCLADIIDFKATDCVLHAAPLSHGSGIYMIPALVRGAENIIAESARFDPDDMFVMIEAKRVTVIAFVAPTMIVRMLAARSDYDITSLRAIAYGGAPIHIDHIRAAVTRFGPIFHQLYGQGEAPMTISHLPAAAHVDADDDTLLSAGFVRTGVSVRIIDDTGRVLRDGEEGEICVSGDVVMREYWRNPEATAAALCDGWLRTGDIGLFNGKGHLRLLDRRHDTIISGGTNIYPKEVEDVVASHPSVREVVAFGLADPEWGESVAVAIVVRDGAALEASQLIAFCTERMARFKRPKHVILLSELPQSAYGKVLRRELQQRCHHIGSAAAT